MNISNTISYDSNNLTKSAESTHSKNDLSARKIQQNIPKLRENNRFNDNLKTIDKIDISTQKEQLSEIRDVIDESNKDFRTFDRRLDISVHEKTSEIMVKVVDTLTDEIIKEIPAENVLDTLAKSREFIGMMMDKQI